MQVARTGVITQPCPQFEHGIERRRGQRIDGRKALEKTLVVGNDRRHLRLLQHDFRQPDAVSIARPLPGQIVAPLLALPDDQPLRE